MSMSAQWLDEASPLEATTLHSRGIELVLAHLEFARWREPRADEPAGAPPPGKAMLLELGAPLGANIACYNAFRCRLYVADAYRALRDTPVEDAAAAAVATLPMAEGERLHAVFAWDILSFLDPVVVTALAMALGPHCGSGTLLHTLAHTGSAITPRRPRCGTIRVTRRWRWSASCPASGCVTRFCCRATCRTTCSPSNRFRDESSALPTPRDQLLHDEHQHQPAGDGAVGDLRAREPGERARARAEQCPQPGYPEAAHQSAKETVLRHVTSLPACEFARDCLISGPPRHALSVMSDACWHHHRCIAARLAACDVASAPARLEGCRGARAAALACFAAC